MKKKSSKSKRAWIVAGAMIFGGAALISTGLATWVIGAQVTTNDESIGVTVDTATNTSIILSMTIDDSNISLTENEDVTNTWKHLSFDTTIDKTALNISFSKISISIGESIGETPTKITFSLPTETSEDITDIKSNAATIVTSDLTGDRSSEVTSWTYIEAPDAIAIDASEDSSNANFVKSTAANGQIIYTMKAGSGDFTQSFKWGSFFGGVSPVNYYSTQYYQTYAEITDENQEAFSTLAANITTELNTMHNALDSKQLLLRAEVSFD